MILPGQKLLARSSLCVKRGYQLTIDVLEDPLTSLESSSLTSVYISRLFPSQGHHVMQSTRRACDLSGVFQRNAIFGN